jgi:serine/threonine protein kinase
VFEILTKLGEGSYGAVWKARDKRDGQIVAIKVSFFTTLHN